MLVHYIKSSLRSLWKFKGYTVVNILGLSVGIACCLLIVLFVYNEWRFDQFHQDVDRIYRVTTVEKLEEGSRHLANCYGPVAPLLQNTFSTEFSSVVRYFPYSVSVKNPENNTLFQEKQFYFADSLFFQLFSFDFVKGNPASALLEPNALVLTEATARRYFGENDPIGKVLKAEGTSDFVVTGVIKNPPASSSLQFDFIAAMPSIATIMGPWVLSAGKTWHYPPMHVFVKTIDNQAISRAQQQMAAFNKTNLPDYLVDTYQFQFQPLKDLHFTPLEGDFAIAIKPIYLYVLLLVAGLILAIACVNYINLSLSRLIQRFREIGMRRVLGAQHRQISLQMLTESLVALTISSILALLLINSFLPLFNRLIDKQLVLWNSSNIWLGLGIIGMLLLIAILISVFPTMALSRFKVGNILKGEIARTARRFSGLSLKNSFVVFQFTVAVGLIAATLIVQYQLNYIRSKDIGLQPQQTLVIPIRDEAVQQNFQAIKNTLRSVTGVQSVSALSNFPWEDGFWDFPSVIERQGKNIEANIPTLFVDEDFLRTMGMQVVNGRDFRSNSISDQQSAFLLNETAAKKFGIQDVQGLRIQSESGDKAQVGEIIGIVKDFHLKSLHHPIDPIAMTTAPAPYYIDNFVLRLETSNLAQTLRILGQQWSEISPDRPFEYFFLDETFEQLYRRETRMGSLFSYFTLLALFIACLGMFALAAFMSERRTKEIGIRKVLGANVQSIVALLSKDFLLLVIIAAFIAFPIAWWAMNQWLADFAYRIDIQWWMFALAGVAAVGIALLTVSFQAIRAAVANPVNALKTE